MADATVRGRFVWHDLLTPNAAGAHEFYGKALGWTTEPWKQDPSYLMFGAAQGPIGGAVETRATTPLWLPYIGTTDVDATIGVAVALGARVQTPAEPLPNGARYAVLVDPQGAPFGIHSSSAAAEPEAAPRPGEFSWHELATTVAPGSAFEFYATLFGWDELSQFDMGPTGKYLIFGRNGRQLGGVYNKGNAGKPYWLGYVRVTDLEAAIERAKAARGSLLTGPMDVPGGDRVAQLMDPHGAFFALHLLAADKGNVAKAAKPARAAAPGKKAPTAAKPSTKKPVPKKAAARKPAKAAAKPKAKKRAGKAATARPKKAKPGAKPKRR